MVGCMSRVNGGGQSRLILKLLARHASEMWWAGGKAACKNLETIKGTLAGAWWKRIVKLQGCGKWGPDMEEAGRRRGKNKAITGKE